MYIKAKSGNRLNLRQVTHIIEHSEPDPNGYVYCSFFMVGHPCIGEEVLLSDLRRVDAGAC